MEQRTIRLNFDLSFVYGPRTLRVPLVAALLLAAVGELNSESVTLSTYYPAPSGVYTKMITTGDTYMSRDSGDVTVGTGNSLSKLGVNGSLAVGSYATTTAAPSNGLIVSGNVGIGTSSPGTYKLSVTGNANVTGNASVSGNLAVAGTAPGAGPYVYVDASGSSCNAQSTNNLICASGRYITWAPGIYVVGQYWRTGPNLNYTVVSTPLGNQTNITTTAPTFYCCLK